MNPEELIRADCRWHGSLFLFFGKLYRIPRCERCKR